MHHVGRAVVPGRRSISSSFFSPSTPGDFDHRFLVTSILLLSGALVGLASFYKDSAVATLKDWYPSDRPVSK